MSYMHISNLYKDQSVLLLKKVWATEKIHGTSACLTYEGDKNQTRLLLHPGGAKMEMFEQIFDQEKILAKCIEMFGDKRVRFIGEHYGGKIQKMRETYGDDHRFALFEIKVDDVFLSFDKVQKIGEKLGLDVVYGKIVDATVEALNQERDADSYQAKKNGIAESRKREGIVSRPLVELTLNNGQRVIAKHKREEFRETTTKREVSAEQQKIYTEADEIADEWVTPMRLQHVLDAFPDASMEQTGKIIKAMLDDVTREGKGEIVMTKEANRAIGKRTAKLFKEHLQARLKEN